MVDSPGESRYHTLPHERVPQIPAPYLLSLLLSCPVTRLQLFCAYSSRRGCRHLVSIRDTAAGACGAGTRRGRDVARCRRRRSRSAGADCEGAGGAGAAGGVGVHAATGAVCPRRRRGTVGLARAGPRAATGAGRGAAARAACHRRSWTRTRQGGALPPCGKKPLRGMRPAARLATAAREEAAARDAAGDAAWGRRAGRGRRRGARPSAGMRRTARPSGGCTTREETGRGRVGEDLIKIKLITGPKNF